MNNSDAVMAEVLSIASGMGTGSNQSWGHVAGLALRARKAGVDDKEFYDALTRAVEQGHLVLKPEKAGYPYQQFQLIGELPVVREEPLLTSDQVLDLLSGLKPAISDGLRERLNAVLGAKAPGPFSDALGELEAYLAGLDDAGSLPFEKQIQLKAYVMRGWKEWRAGFDML